MRCSEKCNWFEVYFFKLDTDMNYDIFEDTDSFSTIVEKERQQKTQTQKLIENNRNNFQRKYLMWNLITPVVCVVLCVIFTFGFNTQIVDKCGCEFETDVSSNPFSGFEYYVCAISHYACYSEIEYED